MHGFSSTAEGYLKTTLHGIASASKVNAAFSQAWVATPHVSGEEKGTHDACAPVCE
jgi:hypothetical protein